MRKKQSNLIFLSTVLAAFIGIVALFLGFVLPVFGMSQQIFHNDKVSVLGFNNVPIQALLQLPVQSGESTTVEGEDVPLFDVEITSGVERRPLNKSILSFIEVIAGALVLLGIDIIYRKIKLHARRKKV